MDAEHLEYFKAALEGRASVGWNVWFTANQQALAQHLSRPALLRLKSSKLDEAERLLADSGWLPEPLRMVDDGIEVDPASGAAAEVDDLPDFLSSDGEDDPADDEEEQHMVAAE